MPAIVVAARSAPQVIACGEDDIAEFIEVIIVFQRGEAARLGEDFIRVVEFVCEPRKGVKARAAEARGLDLIGGEAVDQMCWYDDFMTPAWAFI